VERVRARRRGAGLARAEREAVGLVTPVWGLIASPMTYVYVETDWPGFSSESYGATALETTSCVPVDGL
jgi:hypothetical protein